MRHLLTRFIWYEITARLLGRRGCLWGVCSRCLLLLRLTEEFATEALVLIISHNEHLFDPLYRISIQLLVGRLAILASLCRAHGTHAIRSYISNGTVCCPIQSQISLCIRHALVCHGFLINLHGVSVEFPLKFSGLTNALFMIVRSRLARMGL